MSDMRVGVLVAVLEGGLIKPLATGNDLGALKERAKELYAKPEQGVVKVMVLEDRNAFYKRTIKQVAVVKPKPVPTKAGK